MALAKHHEEIAEKILANFAPEATDADFQAILRQIDAANPPPKRRVGARESEGRDARKSEDPKQVVIQLLAIAVCENESLKRQIGDAKEQTRVAPRHSKSFKDRYDLQVTAHRKVSKQNEELKSQVSGLSKKLAKLSSKRKD